MRHSELSDEELLRAVMKSAEGTIIIAAILCCDTGHNIVDITSKYSRGAFKRAIAWLRMAQRDAPEYSAKYEEAISYIRGERLYREVTARNLKTKL